jgi:hypothetical protein
MRSVAAAERGGTQAYPLQDCRWRIIPSKLNGKSKKLLAGGQSTYAELEQFSLE